MLQQELNYFSSLSDMYQSGKCKELAQKCAVLYQQISYSCTFFPPEFLNILSDMRPIFQRGLNRPLGYIWWDNMMMKPWRCSEFDNKFRHFFFFALHLPSRHHSWDIYYIFNCWRLQGMLLFMKHLFNAWLIITAYIKHNGKMTTSLTVITDWV